MMHEQTHEEKMRNILAGKPAREAQVGRKGVRREASRLLGVRFLPCCFGRAIPSVLRGSISAFLGFAWGKIEPLRLRQSVEVSRGRSS